MSGWGAVTIRDGLAGRMVAPRADGVEIGDQVGRKVRGERLAAELLRKAGGEVLKHGELDQERVARRPRCRLIAQQAELDGQVIVLGGDGGVDSARIDIQPVLLIGGQSGNGAVGGGAQLQRALQAVVVEQRCGRGSRPARRRRGGAAGPSARGGPAR